MTNLPTGVITFLFTDVEGSTRLWELYPDAMREALAHHDALIESCVTRHAGLVVRPRGEGDSRFAVFPYATDAVAAACAIQQALHAEDWGASGLPRGQRVRVRMALHTGQADLRMGDYYGSAVNRCARLRAIAHGGQTLLSRTTAELAQSDLPGGVSLRDLGEHRLKDLSRPEHVFQLVIPGVPNEFLPPASLDQRPTNLPIQSTALIGREHELAAAQELLVYPEVRLLTLIGPGGVGKTRLGLQIAAELLDDFADGVYFINLAPISDPALVPTTIAQALGVVEAGGQPLMASLRAYLRERELLLLLDNFEQVVVAAPLVAELLTAAPRLKALITSRVVLRVYGEHEFPVQPLALPDLGRFPAVGEGLVMPPLIAAGQLPDLARHAAVELFVQRARAARPDFTLTPTNARVVAEICHRLDGLPLAIELAAARIKVLTPAALLDRLGRRLDLLTGGARDRTARQQTLRGAIAWSYDLLDESERTLFARLAIFVGGCTIEAAETVLTNGIGLSSGLSPLPPLDLDILDGLASLVDKSLLQQLEAGEGEPRFTMLETIREYALEQLTARKEIAALRQRHALYYLDLAEQARPELTGPQQAEWLARLEQEHDNLRAALRWAIDHGTEDMALRLAGSLWRFWYTHGYLSEGRRWLETALALFAVEAPPAGTPLDPAREQLMSARALALRGAGGLAWAQGDYARARICHEESLAMYRALDDEAGVAHALINLGVVAHDQGDYPRAQTFYEESLALERARHDMLGMARVLNNLGLLARDQGNLEEARRFYAESLALLREHGDIYGIARALTNLGEVAQDQGNHRQAYQFYAESLALRQELGDREGSAYCLEGLAGIAAAQNQSERAARLWGAAEVLREEIGAPLPPADRSAYERMVTVARSRIDERAWESAWAAGRTMALEQAIAAALGETDTGNGM